jgi:hypothetical protein
VSAQEFVDQRELRLARRRAARGYWVYLADTGRVLGCVYPHKSRWTWETSASAYRGDGRKGHERDGVPSERVPAYLLLTGRSESRRDACFDLFSHLKLSSAAALDNGPLTETARQVEELAAHG